MYAMAVVMSLGYDKKFSLSKKNYCRHISASGEKSGFDVDEDVPNKSGMWELYRRDAVYLSGQQ